MPDQAFDFDCYYCQKKLHCPSDEAGRRIRCSGCGSAMMADPARKSHDSIMLPDVKIETGQDNTDL